MVQYTFRYVKGTLNFNKSYSDDLNGDILSSEAGLIMVQPTISICINGLDHDDFESLSRVLKRLYELENSVKKAKQIVLDIDSTLFQVYRKQEQGAYNYHYSSNGYHHLMLYNGMN